MTRSIFDPGSREVERGGSTFLGDQGQNRSQMPPDMTDGKVEADEELAAGQSEAKEEVAERLERMNRGDEAAEQTLEPSAESSDRLLAQPGDEGADHETQQSIKGTVEGSTDRANVEGHGEQGVEEQGEERRGAD